MSPSKGFFALALVLSVLALQGPPVRGYIVQISNLLGSNETLNIHCQSKDDDLGSQDLPYGGYFQWSFQINIWKTTLFYCDMSWGNGAHGGHYDIFKAKRDNSRCPARKCYWKITHDGLYLFERYVNDYTLQFRWER